ncbi:MAG: hypothetical protein F4Z57_00020 [Gemmatimonadetes bacterium]|nr:hypothetical protein [Gemmatimonadota bacterium]MYC69659.1 hypothetical protein [Gemmatimonadota bacterium]
MNAMTPDVLVLYSGGRDSSAATVEMALKKNYVKLFTFQAGALEVAGRQGDSAPEIRHKELLTAFPEHIDPQRAIDGSTYIIRKLGIEKTNTAHVVYPITLALAAHCEAITYSLKYEIKKIACGYSGYQSDRDIYIEQRSDFAKLTADFVGEYGIAYHLPVIDKSESEIKNLLERHGISSNSLENKSLFGGVSFDIEYAHQYWNSCIPFCRKYLHERLSGTCEKDSQHLELT